MASNFPSAMSNLSWIAPICFANSIVMPSAPSFTKDSVTACHRVLLSSHRCSMALILPRTFSLCAIFAPSHGLFLPRRRSLQKKSRTSSWHKYSTLDLVVVVYSRLSTGSCLTLTNPSSVSCTPLKALGGRTRRFRSRSACDMGSLPGLFHTNTVVQLSCSNEVGFFRLLRRPICPASSVWPLYAPAWRRLLWQRPFPNSAPHRSRQHSPR